MFHVLSLDCIGLEIGITFVFIDMVDPGFLGRRVDPSTVSMVRCSFDFGRHGVPMSRRWGMLGRSVGL